MLVMLVIRPRTMGILWIAIQIFCIFIHLWILGLKLDLSMDIFLHICIFFLVIYMCSKCICCVYFTECGLSVNLEYSLIMHQLMYFHDVECD